jgi:hypothetical protein
MRGKTLFSIPDAEKLRIIQNNESLERKKQLTKDLPQLEQGIIHLVNLELKGEEEKKKEEAKDQIKSYIKHF